MNVFRTIIESLATIAAFAVVLFALSQAWLALNYWFSKRWARRPKRPAEWPGRLPRVLLQLPVFNERYVIERLLASVAKLDYPRNLLKVQVLDDSTDDTTRIAAPLIAKLKASGMDIEHIHRVDRSGFKAGALQAGLDRDDSEFVAIFDADFLPPTTFIKQIVRYFTEPDIGMVQTRWEHLNAEYSLLTKLLAFGIDAHFSVEQGGRQATNSFINFNGTAGMWRRKTIDDAGGWHSDCLTEDLDLSFRAQLLGWRFLFIEEMTTPSELPVEMSAIRTQQFRWTKGAAETGRKNLSNLWFSSFPVSTKVIGSFHMLNSLVFPVLVLLSLSLATFPFLFGARTAAAFMPIGAMLLISSLAIIFTYWVAHISGNFRSSAYGTTTILSRAVLFMLITGGLGIHNSLAVLQGLFGRVTPFVRTPKLNIIANGQKISDKRSYAIPASLGLLTAELCFALLFVGLALYCFYKGLYLIVPSLLFFAAGYVMVVYFTMSPVPAAAPVMPVDRDPLRAAASPTEGGSSDSTSF